MSPGARALDWSAYPSRVIVAPEGVVNVRVADAFEAMQVVIEP